MPVNLCYKLDQSLGSNKLKVFYVHEDLLTKRTEYFKTCLPSNFKEGHARVLTGKATAELLGLEQRIPAGTSSYLSAVMYVSSK
jgi:hypothetical protein